MKADRGRRHRSGRILFKNSTLHRSASRERSARAGLKLGAWTTPGARDFPASSVAERLAGDFSAPGERISAATPPATARAPLPAHEVHSDFGQQIRDESHFAMPGQVVAALDGQLLHFHQRFEIERSQNVDVG